MADFSLPHIDVSGRHVSRSYQAPQLDLSGSGTPRTRTEHGARLREQLDTAFRDADNARPAHPELSLQQGSYLEVEVTRGKQPEKLERKQAKIRPGAVQVEPNESTKVVLYVPDDARELLQSILDEYASGDLTEKGHPPKKAFVEPIEEIRQAHIESFWTDDPNALPTDAGASIWWELWCYPGTETQVIELVERLEGRTADKDYWLSFPESIVVPVYTTRAAIELLLFAPFGLLELRRASACPLFFTEAGRQDQYDWAVELAERVTWPGNNVPTVCLFDTGVNRGHVLIEPALAPNDLLSVRPEWGGDDHEGHGTQMAGLILHGDLTPRLVDESEYTLEHRLESVKLLPPGGFPPNNPKSLGAITQAAVARSEINAPDRTRVYCMAITNEDVSGARSSTWSAAIDQAAAGVMAGDGEDAPARLIVLSCGNIPAHIEYNQIQPAASYPIEDPSQAWNALTVGGYTDKQDITEEDLEGWTPYADAGDLSPFSRTSEFWPSGKSPYKPDIVMEAGNRAVSPNHQDVLSTDSLSILTTGADTNQQPLTPFCATSAATALAARLAARLAAAHPDYWPETIRALIVHSAEWTPAMREQLNDADGMRDRYSLLRRFGYGVPSYTRATASAQNHLAMVAQNNIQPFKNDSGRKFNDCHFYSLPWPRDQLEELGDTTIRLKITLSYFVEPNPGMAGSINPQRYQSYGLRFELRRPLEEPTNFVRRVNVLEREDPSRKPPSVEDDGRWTFGVKSISAGSLHCDEWVGPAAVLANRDILCIKPVAGWWRDRASLDICHRQARYALVITVATPDEDITLHTSISKLVETDIGVEIPIRV